MKKVSLFIFPFLLTLLIPSVSAQEGILPEKILSPEIGGQVAPGSFYVMVTGSGKLIVNPGQTFTEGKEEPGTILPYLISEPKTITYPAQALTQGWQGKIVIAIEVLTDGSVGSYQVMQSTGRPVLDETAVQAVQSWKFHPAIKADGQPIRTCIQIPVTFQIQDE